MGNRGRILILVEHGYEEMELWYPKLRLEEAGYETAVAGLGASEYKGKHGYPCRVDGPITAFNASELKGLVIPGGHAPQPLRQDPHVLGMVRELHEAGRLLAAICHGAAVLASAGIVAGRRIASHPGVRSDLLVAGASWADEPVVIDGNLVTSRRPEDLPLFGASIVRVLWEREFLSTHRYEPHAPV